MDGIVAFFNDTFVDDIQHFKERGLWRDIFGSVGVDAAFGFRSGLAPNFESEIHEKM